MARSKPSCARCIDEAARTNVSNSKRREARLRDEAAVELGKLLVECGAETIDPAQLRQLVRRR